MSIDKANNVTIIITVIYKNKEKELIKDQIKLLDSLFQFKNYKALVRHCYKSY